MDSDNNQVKELVEEKETNRKAPAMQLSLADLKVKLMPNCLRLLRAWVYLVTVVRGK